MNQMNTAQDDEQHTTTFGRRNHEEKTQIYVTNHLFRLN